MEINGTKPLIVAKNGVQRPEPPQPSGRTLKGGVKDCSDADRLDLSARSMEIARLNDLIQSTPDIRESRVEQVRKELEGGTYSVKAEKIAEKLIKGNLLDEFF